MAIGIQFCRRDQIATRMRQAPAQVGVLAGVGDSVGLGVDSVLPFLVGAGGICLVGVSGTGCWITLGGVGGGGAGRMVGYR